MRVEDETSLSRALLGDGEARQALARKKAASPELAAELEPLERAWERLELPPATDAPAGFAARTVAVARAERSLLPGFTLSPAWAGVTAAVLVAVGVAGGAGLGAYALSAEQLLEEETVVEEGEFWADDGLLDERLFEIEGAVDESGGAEVATEVAP